MRRALTAEDFVTGESLKSAGILDVFPTFQTARMGQKIRCSAEAELFRGSLKSSCALKTEYPGIRYVPVVHEPRQAERHDPMMGERYIRILQEPGCYRLGHD